MVKGPLRSCISTAARGFRIPRKRIQPDAAIWHYALHVKTGNPYDNAMAENFFSTLKSECICRSKPAAFHTANESIDRHIHFYSHTRIP